MILLGPFLVERCGERNSALDTALVEQPARQGPSKGDLVQP